MRRLSSVGEEVVLEGCWDGGFMSGQMDGRGLRTGVRCLGEGRWVGFWVIARVGRLGQVDGEGVKARF